MLPINVYPYLNLNDLNLDYILKTIGELRYEVTNFVSINAIKYADPIQWNITTQYEKNTIVIDPVTGTAYISVAPVPAGVALTRTEFWTVVFDLGSFVTRAAQNFTSNWESETTTTATFATNTGKWLVWGDVLYKALTNITAGDTYVVGGNIEHFTIEDLYNAYLNTIANILAIVGDLADLTTSDTTSIVNAINSVKSELDNLSISVGDLANLTTSDISSIVNAINEVNAHVGDITTLTTTDNSNTVAAINELDAVLNRKINFGIVAAMYVDDANGDDTASGSVDDPVKTLDGAFKILNCSLKEGSPAGGLAVFIVNGSTFDFNVQYLNNSHIHIYNQTGNVIDINFTKNTLQAYTSYVHFIGTATEYINVNFDTTVWGFDNTQFWFTYCNLNSTNNNQEYCHTNSFVIEHCTVNAYFKFDTHFKIYGSDNIFNNTLWIRYGSLELIENGAVIFNKGLILHGSYMLLRTGSIELHPSNSRNCIEAFGSIITIMSQMSVTIGEDDTVGTSVIFNMQGSVFMNDVDVSTQSLTDKYNYYIYGEGSILNDRNHGNVSGVANNYRSGSRLHDLYDQGAAIANISAAPTQSDFNNLLTQLRTAGVIAP